MHGGLDDSGEPEKELVMRNIRLEMLNLTAIIPVLNKHHLLTLDDNYVLLNYLVSPMERANALIYQILPSKGPGAFKKFILCLQEETEHIGHQELARILITPAKRKYTYILHICDRACKNRACGHMKFDYFLKFY